MVNPHVQQTFGPEGVQVPSGPVTDIIPVTPSDSVDLVAGIKSIYIGMAGTVAMLMYTGQVRTISLPAGWHPIVPRRIRSTGTTATGIHVGV